MRRIRAVRGWIRLVQRCPDLPADRAGGNSPKVLDFIGVDLAMQGPLVLLIAWVMEARTLREARPLAN